MSAVSYPIDRRCGPVDLSASSPTDVVSSVPSQQTNMTKPGKGILAMDESNATCGARLEGVGVENIEENRRRYRELLITTPGLGEHIGGAILFEETLYQSCADGTSFVDALKAQGVYPGIKVDKVSVRECRLSREQRRRCPHRVPYRSAAYFS